MIFVALKDLKVILKDRKALLLSFLLPVVLVGLFAFVYGGMAKPREENPVGLIAADMDRTPLTENIIKQLDSLKSINLIRMSPEEARQKVTSGAYPAVLVFEQGFSDSVNSGGVLPLKMEYDPSRELETGLLQQAIMAPIMNTTGGSWIKNRVLAKARKEYESLDSAELAQIESGINEGFFSGKTDETFRMQNPIIMTPLIPEERANWALIQAVAGTAVMMLLFSVAGIGAGLLAEREQGTLKRLLISPLKNMHILYGKLLATLAVSLIQMVIVFIFAGLVFHLDLSVNPAALVFMVIATAFACASFGIFLAAVSTSRKQVEMLSTLIILIMSAVGGSMIPLPIMPAVMKKIAVVSVNYWSIQGFYDIFWRQLPFIGILPRIAVLMGIGTCLILLSKYFFKRNIIELTR